MKKKNTKIKKQTAYSPFGGGLLPTPPDSRDFSLAGVFGAIDVKSIPNEDFFVGEPTIKNQGRTDLCTAFSACLVSEYQEEIELSPEFFFSQIKKIRGEYKQWGADLRSGCKAAQEVGFLARMDAPFSLADKGRDFLANWKNWPDELLPLAKKHVKESFFKVDGPYDNFDNIRVALWQNKGQKRAIYTGCVWRDGWTFSAGGVIPKSNVAKSFGHAFAIDGQKIINGVPYLRVPNSAGDSVGDKGFFYFPREVVNRDFNFGSYMFIDMPPAIAKELNDKAVKGEMYIPPVPNKVISNSWFTKLIRQLISQLKKYE